MSYPKMVRLKSWQEFKKVATETNAKTVLYVIAQSIPNKNYTGLKLIVPTENSQYIFTDTANGDQMRRTKIPVHTGVKGNRFITDEDIKRFLRTEIQNKELQIFSYWTA
ncbi:MAG: hypothetical protein WC325_07075 [Candidatus Bathyarchaeia archaeon]|jgi:hypothetical protein